TVAIASVLTSVHYVPEFSIGIRAGTMFCIWASSREDTFWHYGQGRSR
ncbi:hypothetical protein A2U01_0084055, partial [Trifolium medium]|nr:hypothetical protein [Trifolium medium]